MRTNNNDIATSEQLQIALRFYTGCMKMKDYGYPYGINLEPGLFMLLLRSN